ncbi:MAG: hypothetical protein IH626_21025 [Rhodospirillales bacterium]|nr:hypothetical protein [Rhodospirillales bacterium]
MTRSDVKFLVIRVANMDNIDAIDELDKCIAEQGVVWFGKYGRGVSATQLGAFNGTEKKYAILVYKGKPGRSHSYSYHWYEIKAFSRKVPPSGSYPQYYKPFLNRINTWLKLSQTEMNMPGINDLYTKSSLSPVTESLSRSMSAHFFCILRH